MADEQLHFRGRIVYQRFRSPRAEEIPWRVVTVRPEIPGPDITLTGNVPDFEPDDIFEFYGTMEDTKHGPTLVATQVIPTLPVNLDSLAHFLARTVKGVGPSTADRIIKKFGEDTVSVLDNHPERLKEILTEAQAEKIAMSWQESHNPLLRQVGLFLAQYGISHTYASKCIAVFGVKTIEMLTQNPYWTIKVHGVGFLKADEFAERMGWPEKCPERTEAAVRHLVGESVNDGHCYVEHKDLLRNVRRLAAARKTTEDEAKWLSEEEAEDAIRRVELRREILQETIYVQQRPWVLYFPPYIHEAECRLAARIGEMLQQVHTPPANLEETLKRVEADLDMIPNGKQHAAVVNAFRYRLSLLTGFPGTGKTTALKFLIQVAKRLGILIVCCAPTGRAAKRMTEVTGLEAQTIHKLLEWEPENGGGFYRCRQRPIDADLLICDESSMVDIILGDKLFDALPDNCSVVLVGDVDQLPSVGPGMVLRDMIGSRRIVTTVLDQIHRQAEGSLIIRNAHRIRNGEMPNFPDKSKGKNIEADSYFMEVPKALTGDDRGKDDIAYVKQKLPLVIDRLVEKYKLDPIRDIQVLVPMKIGKAGAPEFNQVLQEALNPGGREVDIQGKKFRTGDRVMQLVNNYKLDISNGDIGFIKSFNEGEKELTIDFYGQMIKYPYSEVRSLSLAYASTIHKCQGSEYPAVLTVLTSHHYAMLERNLLYTACTRAKKILICMASWFALQRAVNECNTKQRNTFLKHRIRAAVPGGPLAVESEPVIDRTEIITAVP